MSIVPGKVPQAPGKVVFVSGHDTRGGTTNFIKVLRRRFEQDGFACRSVALYPGYIPDPTAVELVLTGRPSPGVATLLTAVARLVSLCRREPPVALLGLMPFSNVAAGIAARFGGGVVICGHHSPYDQNGRLVRLLDKIAGSVGLYREVICVSEAVAKSFAKHPWAYRRRLRVIANGVPPIAQASDRAATVARLGLPSDLPIVFMAGRLAEQKNVLMAVRAISQVAGARLVMSGEGPLREQIIALVAELGLGDRVHLLGLIDKQDMVDLMANSDAFMQISHYEGQSMALLEAIYVGALPIVSDIAVQTEVIRMGDGALAGVVCDQTDVTSVARALRALLFDPAVRGAVSKNVAQLAPILRTEAQMVDDYAALLQAASNAAAGQEGHSHG